ncbi:MAG: phage major capsid protein [Selenomonadaceae bacterium]|nr:phage major capsid protein [Selenomonadaceae bacterium]
MNYKGLVEKKNDLITRAEAILNDAETNKRELTDDEAQELAEIRDDVRKIKEALKIHDELKEEKKELKEEAAEDAAEAQAMKEAACKEEADRRAFEAYVRGVVLNERDAVNMTKAANGAVIPTTIANKIIAMVYNICPILEKSTKYNVKGKLVIPYYDEDTNAITVNYASEFEELTSNVGAMDKIELDGFLAGTLTLISRSLINNAQFNIVDFIVERMAYAIKRFIEDQLLNGYVPSGASAGVTGLSTLTNSITAAATTAITADEVVRLHDAIKDDFQGNAIWIMSPATRTALRTLKSNTGYYLLNDDISTPFGTSLLGKPVYVSDNMPDMGAGKTAIYYGDMRGLATKFSEEMSIEVLREKYATQHAVGVVGWLEFDAKVEDAQKIAKLVMAAN